jgi:hypothetical protein
VDGEHRNGGLWCFDQLQIELLNVACHLPPSCLPPITLLFPTLPVPPTSLPPNRSLTKAFCVHMYVTLLNLILQVCDNDMVHHDIEERWMSAIDADCDVGGADLDAFKLPDGVGGVDARAEKLDIFLIVGRVDGAGDVQYTECLPDREGRVDQGLNRVAGGRVNWQGRCLACAVSATV